MRFATIARGMGRRASFLVPAGLFLLAVAIRALPLRGLLLEERVVPFGHDAFYHLRRIAYSIANFPEALTFDRYLNFPHGGKPIWTPVLDWSVAALLSPFALPLEEMERIVVWLPPLLGGATVVALTGLAHRFFDRAVAWLAGAILAVLSGHFWYSQIGFVDHHAAVALASVGVLGAGMALLDAHSVSRGPRGAGFRLEACAGLAFAGALLLWPGSLLHVGLVQAGLAGFLFTRVDGETARRFAGSLAAVHAVGFLLLWPAGAASEWPQWGAVSPVVLSWFQPWLFASLALLCAGCATGWRRPLAGGSRARRVASATAGGAALLGASAFFLPGLVEGALDAWQWMARDEAFQARVSESRPLLFEGSRFTLETAAARLSWFVVAAPVALPVAAFLFWRDPRPAPRLLFLWWTLGMLVATLLQRRFFNTSSIAIALLLAWSAVASYRMIARALAVERARHGLAALAVAVALHLCLAPSLSVYRVHLDDWRLGLAGEPPRPSTERSRRLAALETAAWIREHTPETSGWLDARVQPEYAVLAPWPLGHLIKYEGRRPVVTDNFGDDVGAANFAFAQRYALGREAEAQETLERLGVRYVVAQRLAAYLGAPPAPDSMFETLMIRDGDALERHRLVFESRPDVPGDASAAYKVFEFVEGARVRGRAEPGAEVRVALKLRTHRGRRVHWATRTTADENGRYSLRLPHANEGGPGAVTVSPAYRVRADGASARLVVREADVVAGARVAGPDLRTSRAADPTSAAPAAGTPAARSR